MSLIRLFWKQSLVYGLGIILVRAVSFILLPLYTNQFTTEEAGYIYLMFTFIAFAQVFYNHGMDSAFLKFVAQKDENKNTTINTTLVTLFIVSLLFSMSIFLGSKQLSSLYLGIHRPDWFVLCAAILFFDVNSSRAMTLLRVDDRALYFTYVSIASVIVTIAANILLVINFKMGILGVMLGTVAGSILRWLLIFPIQIKAFNVSEFSFTLLKKMWRFGLPFFPAAIFFMIMEISDRYLLLKMADVHTVGVYSIGYKLGSVLMFLITGFNLAWQPFYLKQAENENRVEIFSKIGNQCLMALILLWALLSAWIPKIMRISLGNRSLIGEEFWAAAEIVPFILLSYVCYAGYILQMPSLYEHDRQKWSPILRGIGATLNICLNIILIPTMGGLGAALATLVSYGSIFGLLYTLNRKWLPMKLNAIKLGLILFMGLIAYSYSIYEQFNIPTLSLYTIAIIAVGFNEVKTQGISFKLMKPDR